MKRLLPLLFLLLSACATGDPGISQAQKNRDALDALKGPTVDSIDKTMLDNALAAEAEGNLSRAGSFYQQLHDRKPEERAWVLALANVQRKANACNDGLANYESLIKKDPKDVDALEGKGLCLMAIGESKESGQIFTEVLAQDPSRWRTLNAVGVLFAGKGKVDEAIAYFEKANSIDGTQIAVLNNLGLVYMLDKRYDAAVETFQRAQKRIPSKSPEKARIEMNLALAYALSGDMDNAQKFASPHVSEAGLYNNLGFFAQLAKDENMARDYLNMALSKSSTYYKKAWNNLELVDRTAHGQEKNTSHGVNVKSGPRTVKVPELTKKTAAKPTISTPIVPAPEPAPVAVIEPSKGVSEKSADTAAKAPKFKPMKPSSDESMRAPDSSFLRRDEEPEENRLLNNEDSRLE